MDDFGSVPFTLEQAVAAGITRAMLRSGRYTRLFRGVFVSSGVELTLRVRAVGALLAVPGGVVSHHTAAELSAACAPPSGEIHVSTLRGPVPSRPRIAGIAVHLVQRLDCITIQEVRCLETTAQNGLRVTTPVRTFLDLAARLELTELVAIADAFVRRTAATPELFIEHAARYRGRGAVLARAAAGLTRTGVDSPMESRLRMLLVLAGLPEPVVNTDITFAAGGWLGRPDLQYPEQKIAIEYDGRHHLDDRTQWRRDIRRREGYAREGWLVRVVTAAYVYSAPLTLLGRIHEDLASRRHPGVPAVLDLAHLPAFAA